MKKYLVLYKAEAAKGGPSVAEMLASATPEQMEAGMAVWAAWHAKCQGSIVDMGAPLGNATNLEGGNATKAETAITGYSILQAASLEDAIALMDGHPHFNMPGAAIEVLESIPMPGM
jgi:hypothetical protein